MEFPVNNNNYLRDKKKLYVQIWSQSSGTISKQFCLLPAANDPCPWNRIRSKKTVNTVASLFPLGSCLNCAINPSNYSTWLQEKCKRRKRITFHRKRMPDIPLLDFMNAFNSIFGALVVGKTLSLSISRPLPCLDLPLTAVFLQLKSVRTNWGLWQIATINPSTISHWQCSPTLETFL